MHLWCKIWKSQVTVRNVDLRVFWGRPWGVFTPQTGLKAIKFYLKWFSTVGTCEKWSFPAFITSLEPRRIKDGISFLLHKHEMLDCLYIGYSSKVTLRIFTLSELQVLNEKGYKAVENRIQWAAICRILVCGSWGQTNGDGAAERTQAERHVPGGIRGFLITEKRCEGFVLFRHDLSSRQVRLGKLRYFSSPPKKDLPVRKVILSFSAISHPHGAVWDSLLPE